MLQGCFVLFVLVGTLGAIGSIFGVWGFVIAIIMLAILIILANNNNTTENFAKTNTIPNNNVPPQKLSSPINTIQFGYTDNDGNYSYRTVDIKKLDSEYLEAFCHKRQDMRTFRLDRMHNEIVDVSTGEILSKSEWLKYKRAIKSKKTANTKTNKIKTSLPEICFTGFNKTDRECLENLATLNGYIVRKGITINLNYLVCGTNAGSAKVAQARENSATILTEKEFLSLIKK